MKPTGIQNFMEWIMDFVKGIINSNDGLENMVDSFICLELLCIMYIFVANMLGLPFSISRDEETLVEITNSRPSYHIDSCSHGFRFNALLCYKNERRQGLL